MVPRSPRVPRSLLLAASAAAVLLSTPAPLAQPGPCPFDNATLTFVGSPVDQARCLLRPVLRYGHLGPPLDGLPPPLGGLVGTNVSVTTERLRAYLRDQGIREADLGGPLDAPLSRANNNDPRHGLAGYFVIHDTSSPNYLDAPFPPDIDRDSWAHNNLSGSPRVAHVFVSRTGGSRTVVGFATPYRATKFELRTLGVRGKGLFLHIENVQPRRRDPQGSRSNDALSPAPGFPAVQLDRLALLYVAASLRRGQWMVPAYHAVLDTGFRGGHDDPQAFDLTAWGARLQLLLDALGAPPVNRDDAAPPLVSDGAAPRWEPARPEGRAWTTATYDALRDHGPALLTREPSDYTTFCPNYRALSVDQREHFWVYLISAMSELESAHDPSTQYPENFPDRAGNPVISRGLLQISIESGNGYGCAFRTTDDLHDPTQNILCGVRILNRWMERDGRIAGGHEGAWRGGARYWSVLRTGRKLDQIRGWTTGVPYCTR